MLEWLRGWLFTGFPWLALGYSQIDLPLLGLATSLGVYGVTFAIVLTAGLINLWPRLPAAIAVLAIWGGGAMLQTVAWVEPAAAPGAGGAQDFALLAGGLDRGLGLLDLMVETGAARSKSEARRLIGQGGVRVNNRRVGDIDSILGDRDLAGAGTVVLRVGKKRYFLARLT